tara:strand:+ start:1455 stop:1733 length:279 start_codon:yes stop_codon:yes gene_type:complete
MMTSYKRWSEKTQRWTCDENRRKRIFEAVVRANALGYEFQMTVEQLIEKLREASPKAGVYSAQYTCGQEFNDPVELVRIDEAGDVIIGEAVN